MVEFGGDKFYSRYYVMAADIIHKHSDRVDGNAPNISDDDALAKVDGRYPNSATTRKMRYWVSSGICFETGWWLRQIETVAVDTPAFSATSFNVTRI